MVLSMTAFARRQATVSGTVLVWEIRSVNHRYLEPGLRLPDSMRSLEPAIRDVLRKAVARGKVDCQLRLEVEDSHNAPLRIDQDLVVRLNNASGEILQIGRAHV